MGFINSKVFKPIRGGGIRAPAADTSNYDSQPRLQAAQPSGGMDFKSFMSNQQQQPQVATATAEGQRAKKRANSRVQNPTSKKDAKR